MSSKKGVWLLPTLNRIELLKECLKYLKDAETSTPGWILVDHGDFIAHQQEYQALDLPEGWEIKETRSVTMGSKFRELWDSYKDFDWVGILNDDHKVMTKGWDKTMLSHLREHLILGTNDGKTPDAPWMFPNKVCGATMIAGKVIRTLGYLMYPGLEQLYIDDCLEALGGQAGCIQLLGNICVFHDHAFKGRTKDSTFDSVYPEGWNDVNHKNGEQTRVFNKWKAETLPKDLEKLIAIQPKQGLMIATPSHDGNCAFGYALGLTDLALFFNKNNIHFEMARVVGSSLIPHARNSLVDMFLKSKCQRLLFVDSDQEFTKEHAMMLFQSNRRIIAGVIPHKRFPINLNFNPIDKHRHYFKDHSNKSSAEYGDYARAEMDQKGEIEVEKAGSGFIMIDRSVFELMKPRTSEYYAFDNNNDVIHNEYFAMGAVNKKYMGEDWLFCKMAKELNIPMFINVNCQVAHQGTFVWRVGM
jgi:hypothetical protein